MALYYSVVPTLRTQTAEETVNAMLYAARQMFNLQGLPGIGPERARRLIARFGSVEAVMRANPQDLESVAGLGRQLASRMRWAVEEPRTSYSPQLTPGPL